MTTEQLILEELKKLTQKVESLEKELAQLKLSRSTYPHPDNPGIILGGMKFPKVYPKLIDGHDAIIKPLVFNEDAAELAREAMKEYEKRKDELWEYWKQNPDKAPRYGGGFNQELFEKAWKDYNPTVTPADKTDYEMFGLKNNCSKCGLKFEGQTMGYVCPHADCPNGVGPVTC